MRSRVFAFIVTALAWAAITTTASAQQDAGRFRGMDTNRDGVISRSEWRGSEQSFRVHDWNGDGVLSGNEVRSGNWRNGRWEDQDYDPQTASRIDWTPAMFATLDHNRDGRITQNEWHYDAETFYRIDRDNNNWISRVEFLGGEPVEDDDRDDQFDYLDADNDGRIEFDEWHGSRAAFNRLDRNRDGIVTRREMLGTETATRLDQFASLDYNQNGVLSTDEWHWSRRSFIARDLNRDGVLTRREFESAAAPTDDAVRTSNVTREIAVDARERWTDTGVQVNAGDMINFSAFGTVRMSPDESDTATPAGSTKGRRAPNSPVRDALAGGLLLKVGESVVRFVGQSGSLVAPASGTIYFGVNDDHLPDNSGEFRVTLTVQPR